MLAVTTLWPRAWAHGADRPGQIDLFQDDLAVDVAGRVGVLGQWAVGHDGGAIADSAGRGRGHQIMSFLQAVAGDPGAVDLRPQDRDFPGGSGQPRVRGRRSPWAG